MRSVKAVLLGAATAVSLGGVAVAETTSIAIGQSGAWAATQFHYDDGTTGCSLATNFGDAHVIVGVAPGEDRLKLLVRYDNWSAPKPFLTGLDILFDGTDRWATDDHNAGVAKNTVDAKIALAASASFVHAFTAGSTMQLTMKDATPITVSLAGTTAVWGPFMDCVKLASPTVVASIANPTAVAASITPTLPVMPAAPVVAAQPPGVSEVGLLTNGGVKHVRGVAGSNTAIMFVLDSGAGDVQLPRDIAGQLALEGALVPTGRQVTFTLADGSSGKEQVYMLRSLTVGERTVTDVECSVTDNGEPLLRQSFLGRLTSWSLDNARQTLLLGKAL